MSSNLAPLKSSEYNTLLRRWGFEQINGGTGHPIWLAPDGVTRFPTSTPGKVTQVELRKAARLVGVSRREFLRGPEKKKRPIRGPLVDPSSVERPSMPAAESSRFSAMHLLPLAEEHVKQLEEIQRLETQAAERAKEKRMARPVERRVEKRRGNGTLTAEVRKYMEDRPNQVVRPMDIQDALGEDRRQGGVNMALKAMVDRGEIERVGTGQYRVKAIGSALVAEQPATEKRNGHAAADVLHFMQNNPGRLVTIAEVSEATGVLSSSVATALRKGTETLRGLTKVSRGLYIYDREEAVSSRDETPVVSTPPAMPENLTHAGLVGIPEPKVTTEKRYTPHVGTMWEQMQDLGDDRFLLRDENGKLWLAKMREVDF